uniref:Uncharacterized protein n=1 Tax=Siphoviridae sp. ctYtb10 TaxID=2825553 RepID=A0A8S5PBB6_9CAUD|nr:MAG TPA: hypothetical protein [Siphoviridae sp. ctYtb10]
MPRRLLLAQEIQRYFLCKNTIYFKRNLISNNN